jgi:hypothetical protein
MLHPLGIEVDADSDQEFDGPLFLANNDLLGMSWDMASCAPF